MISLLATAKPAGGAEITQIVIATADAMIVTTALLVLGFGHRSGRVPLLDRWGRFSERVSGLPAWAALPSGLAAASLITAVFGMYWDIAFHIDNGRDPGPLANPAHYLILVGLFGIFSAGFLAMVMPKDQKPSPSAIRISPTLVRPARRRADLRLRRVRADRLPARRHLAPAVRPGRHPLGPDAPDADRRRVA